MKLDYFTLLSPEPVHIDTIGSIVSPTLKDISVIGYQTYQAYISTLLMDIDTYYKIIDNLGDLYFTSHTEEDKDFILQVKSEYNLLSDELKSKINIFDIILLDNTMRTTLYNALNFFFKDDVIYNDDSKIFITFSGELDKDGHKKPTGIIFRQNYSTVVDVISQKENIQKEESYSTEKIKNKTTAHILEKLKKGAQNTNKNADKKMELGNIISSIAAHHNNLNITNIWNLTIFQLYDQFMRLTLNDLFNIQSMSVAAWGSSDGKFDSIKWYSLLHNN